MGLFPLPTDPEVCAPYLFLSSLYSPGFFQSEIVCRWLKFGQKVLSIINYTDKTMSWFVFFFVSFSKKLNLCGSSCNGISGLTKDSMFQWNRIPSNHLSQNEATENSRVPREKRVGIFFSSSSCCCCCMRERWIALPGDNGTSSRTTFDDQGTKHVTLVVRDSCTHSHRHRQLMGAVKSPGASKLPKQLGYFFSV
jgi:hypothetical protein